VLITSVGSWPRSCSSTMAAFGPGAPVMEPPGRVVAPVWYRPAAGIRYRAQRPGLRCAAVSAVERAVHHVRVELLVAGG
jgi:hypothetical protein